MSPQPSRGRPTGASGEGQPGSSRSRYPADWPAPSDLDRRPGRYMGEVTDGTASSPHAPPLRSLTARPVAAALRAERRAGPPPSLESAPAPSARPHPDGYGPTLLQWEGETRSWLSKLVRRLPFRPHLLGMAAVLVGASLSVGMTAFEDGIPELPTITQLRQRLAAAELAVEAREGELALMRIELERLKAVGSNSTTYGIPMDLAGAIYDIALAEGIDPPLAYALIQVESGFYPRALSPVGAVGLAQVMPATAFEMEPGLRYADLFRRETNLRLGFRYLRQMLEKYDGDLRLALLAYNRGPGTVDSILRERKDPANGYARAVLGRAAQP